jgi:hypothetical protein
LVNGTIAAGLEPQSSFIRRCINADRHERKKQMPFLVRYFHAKFLAQPDQLGALVQMLVGESDSPNASIGHVGDFDSLIIRMLNGSRDVEKVTHIPPCHQIGALAPMVG